jgi:hypothetical protein
MATFFQVDSSADGGNFSIQVAADDMPRIGPEHPKHWMVKSFPSLPFLSGSIPLFAYFRCLCKINFNLVAKSLFSWVYHHFS